MINRFGKNMRALLPALVLSAVAAPTMASTLNQNVSWTIDRAGTTTKYRTVAYGDSIYAGYRGSVFNVARRSAPSRRSSPGRRATSTSRSSTPSRPTSSRWSARRGR
mgnify:CR=1 FL=1